MSVTFPGESNEYRAARDALLKDELELRALIERVAHRRRGLPTGGAVPTDYAFTDAKGKTVHLSDLFEDGKDTLALYSLMYRPDAQAPCPMCTSMLDGLAGQAGHIGQKINFAVVAAARPEQLQALSKSRGWDNMAVLSAQGTTYQSDYHAQTPDGAQLPMMNIFQRGSDDQIHHFWGSEGFFADVEGHPRHVDQLWPLWNMLDLTPSGRGDWFPALSY